MSQGSGSLSPFTMVSFPVLHLFFILHFVFDQITIEIIQVFIFFHGGNHCHFCRFNRHIFAEKSPFFDEKSPQNAGGVGARSPRDGR